MVYLMYGFSLFVYLSVFKSVILSTNFNSLGFAFLFFGLSVFTDNFFPDCRSHYLLEDGTKFLGIISWSFYFITCAHKYMTRLIVSEQSATRIGTIISSLGLPAALGSNDDRSHGSRR